MTQPNLKHERNNDRILNGILNEIASSFVSLSPRNDGILEFLRNSNLRCPLDFALAAVRKRCGTLGEFGCRAPKEDRIMNSSRRAAVKTKFL